MRYKHMKYDCPSKISSKTLRIRFSYSDSGKGHLVEKPSIRDRDCPVILLPYISSDGVFANLKQMSQQSWVGHQCYTALTQNTNPSLKKKTKQISENKKKTFLKLKDCLTRKSSDDLHDRCFVYLQDIQHIWKSESPVVKEVTKFQ